MKAPSFGCITFFKIIQAFRFNKYDEIKQLIKLLYISPLDISELQSLLTNSQWIQESFKSFVQFLKVEAQKRQYDAELVNKLLNDILYPLLEQLNNKLILKKKIDYERLMTNGKIELQKKSIQESFLLFSQAYDINQSQQANLYLIIAKKLILQQKSKKKQKPSKQQEALLVLFIQKLMNFQVRDEQNLHLYERIINLETNINTQLKLNLLKIVIDLHTKDTKLYFYFVELSYDNMRSHQLYQYVEKIKKNCSFSLEKCYCLGRIYFTNKEYEKAIQILLQGEKLIEKNENNKRLAYMYRNNQKGQKYARNISYFKQYDKYYLILGNCMMLQKKYGQRAQEALQFYSRGLFWKKDSTQLLKEIIKYFRRNDKYIAEQIQYIQDALKIKENQNDIDYFIYLAQISRSVGQTQELKSLLQLIDKLFITPQRFKFLAYNYFQLRQYKVAQRYCLIMIDIHVDQSQAYYILGRIHLHESNYTKARQNFLKSLQLEAKHYESSFSIGVILQIQRKYEEAYLQYQKTVEISSDYSKGYEKLCKMLIKLQRKSQVQSVATRLIQENQQNYKGYYYLANIMYEKQDFIESLNYYNKVLKYQPNHFKSNYHIMLLYVILNNRTSAMQHYKTHMITYRQNYVVINVLGYIQLKQGQIEEAIKSFLQSIDLERNYFQPYYHLGEIISKNDKNPQYLQIQNVIQIKSQTPSELFNYALFYLGMGYFETFIQHFSKAIELNKKQLEKNLTTGKRILNDFMKSIIKKFSHLQKLYPENVYFSIVLGHIFRDICDIQKSQRAFKKILQKKMDSQSLSDFLISFYNKHLEWHVNSFNCLMFFCQYLIEEALKRSVSEGLAFYEYLAKNKIQFRSHEPIKIFIHKKMQQSIARLKMQIKQFQENYFTQMKQFLSNEQQKAIIPIEWKIQKKDQIKSLLLPFMQYWNASKLINQRLQICKFIDLNWQQLFSSEQINTWFESVSEKFLKIGYILIIVFYISPFAQYDDSILSKFDSYLINFDIKSINETLASDLENMFPKYQKSDISTNTHLSSTILFLEQPDIELQNTSLFGAKNEDQNAFYTLNQNHHAPNYQNIFQKRLIKQQAKQIKSMINLNKNKASSVHFYSQILQDNQDQYFDQQVNNQKYIQDMSSNFKK